MQQGTAGFRKGSRPFRIFAQWRRGYRMSTPSSVTSTMYSQRMPPHSG